jgi:hypothetical protein
LAASTTYHYRHEATNATGTTYGSDQTFTTARGISNAPQGSWVATYGANGYELAAWSAGSDVVAMPGVSLSVSSASRYLWTSNTTNVRALQSADRSTRNAATYYSSSGFSVALRFSSPYSGKLELYAVDLDNLGRSETITVGNQTATLSDFSDGAWVTLPISAAANSTVTITVTNTGAGNAVLSGIFLGGGGTPPAPNFSTPPQGSWVGTYGSRGYDLAAWRAGSDVVAMPGVSLSVSSASRYLWGSNTTNVRALPWFALTAGSGIHKPSRSDPPKRCRHPTAIFDSDGWMCNVPADHGSAGAGRSRSAPASTSASERHKSDHAPRARPERMKTFVHRWPGRLGRAEMRDGRPGSTSV